MKIFKFGGASLQDASSIKNVSDIVNTSGEKKLLIVTSAIGKTTNALEKVVDDFLREGKVPESLKLIEEHHIAISRDLFRDSRAKVFSALRTCFGDLHSFMRHNKSERYDYVYDQIVGFGELLSSIILSEYLKETDVPNFWIDARKCIKTDSTYREATVTWEETEVAIAESIAPGNISVTQGFIASDPDNFTTTLGREGSDYTAAIFAHALDAESLTIWKDVPGVLNADPREFQAPTLLHQISYEEAVELAFYGASVIHPKTLQPLQGKEIPLFVRSFVHPESNGTLVTRGKPIVPHIPCFIVKKQQVLISLSSIDFSFIVEENISDIFKLFHLYQIKVDLIQNSAISFSVCVDNRFQKLEKLIQHLKARFKVKYNTGVSLYTIRHFNAAAIRDLEQGKEVLLKQTTRDTVQMVTRN